MTQRILTVRGEQHTQKCFAADSSFWVLTGVPAVRRSNGCYDSDWEPLVKKAILHKGMLRITLIKKDRKKMYIFVTCTDGIRIFFMFSMVSLYVGSIITILLL